ncbi:MAG: chemotaxis protein CheX [Phycisphaerae bacterium]|jgi:hypothetical protein
MNPSNPDLTAPPRDLAAIVGDVLGNMAFMVSDEEPTDFPPGAVWVECTIRYNGPPHGRLSCWCTRDFAIQLAANLLGIEPDEGDALVGAEDAVREFMNVLCGQVVTTWHGSAGVFSLSIPAVRECLDLPETPEGGDRKRCALSISGEPFYCTYEPIEGE